MINNLIYDVGMNNGDDTAYYLQCGFNVLAIEANPVLCSQAARRFHKEIEQNQLQILNLGIAHIPGELDFWICETHSEWSSLHRKSASRGGEPHHKITVQCQTFKWVLDNYGIPYYLKIDIEGSDYLCIEDLSSDRLPKYISFEKGKKYPQLLERCNELGYNEYKCISQLDFLPLQLPATKEQRKLEFEYWKRLLFSKLNQGKDNFPVKAIGKILGESEKFSTKWKKERKARHQMEDWTFPVGSSGPFGEKTLGKWQSFTEILSTMRYFDGLFQKGKRSVFWDRKKSSYWADFHVKRPEKL